MAAHSQLLSPAFLVINSQTTTIYLVIAHLELSQVHIHGNINIFILCIRDSTSWDTWFKLSLQQKQTPLNYQLLSVCWCSLYLRCGGICLPPRTWGKRGEMGCLELRPIPTHTTGSAGCVMAATSCWGLADKSRLKFCCCLNPDNSNSYYVFFALSTGLCRCVSYTCPDRKLSRKTGKQSIQNQPYRITQIHLVQRLHMKHNCV